MNKHLSDAAQVLEKALEHVVGDRAETHGDMIPLFKQIAELWEGYLQIEPGSILASDVCNMMELLKIARRCHGAFNPDDFTDGAGYSACSFECRCDEDTSGNREKQANQTALAKGD